MIINVAQIGFAGPHPHSAFTLFLGSHVPGSALQIQVHVAVFGTRSLTPVVERRHLLTWVVPLVVRDHVDQPVTCAH